VVCWGGGAHVEPVVGRDELGLLIAKIGQVSEEPRVETVAEESSERRCSTAR
jgi:hypothetical protein